MHNSFKSVSRATQLLVTVVKGLRKLITAIIIQHIDSLPKYGKKTLDVRRST